MSSLSAKDRVSLCSFTFSDGRRCRAPRVGNNPCFCPYHAEKEARARAAQKLGEDLDYFFSGDYLSACDLSTALARLIPAVVRGDVKSKTAHTVAYLAQTLMQSIHLSKHEYINAFGTDGWREAVRNSVNGNQDYRFPPAPEPEQPALSALRTNLRSESPQPQPPAVAHPFRGEAFPSTGTTSPAPPPTQAQQPASQPAETPVHCHSERSADLALRENLRSEEPAFPASRADHSPFVTHHSPLPQAEGSSPLPPAELPATSHHPACHPVRDESSCLHPAVPGADQTHPIPANQSTRSDVPAAQPDNPPRTCPSSPQPAPNMAARALHYDHNYRLLIDGKPF